MCLSGVAVSPEVGLLAERQKSRHPELDYIILITIIGFLCIQLVDAGQLLGPDRGEQMVIMSKLKSCIGLRARNS